MLTITNPANENILTHLETDTQQSVAAKYKAASSSQIIWAQQPLSERIKVIENFARLLSDKADFLAHLLTAEMGKPLTQAKNEILGLEPRIKFFLDNVEHVLATISVPHQESVQTKEEISYPPLGVVANISAWNYPYFVGANVFIPALLTGNAVLYKPSSLVAQSGVAIADLFSEAGLPNGLFSTLIGSSKIGDYILSQPINALFFTGSYTTGVHIAQSIAHKLIKTQFELGGKDPIYVCEDADLAFCVASIADGAFYNTGQSCCSVERIYVHEKIYEQFVAEFVQTVKNFVVGDPMDEKTYIGPLAQQSHSEFLEDQVNDAKNKGASLLTGGQRLKRQGYFFEPTVLINVNHTMKVMQEESFGPIIGIQKVSDDKEAIHLVNDTVYGLTAGVYTINQKHAQTLLAQINSGSVYWNCCDRVSPRLPWTGWKHSGQGSTLGIEGIKAFVKPKAWHLRLP